MEASKERRKEGVERRGREEVQDENEEGRRRV